jgi:glutathione synthase
MRLGIVTNDVRDLGPQFATTRLAYTALERGHDVWMISVGDISYDEDERIRACGWRAPRKAWKTGTAFLDALRGAGGVREPLTVDDLDVLLLRENPGKDSDRPWAQLAGIMFGRMCAQRGVVVVNDPDGLSRAMSKMYLQEFPEDIRPKTLISRDRDQLRRFAVDQGGGPVVMKPLLGSGGRNVFLVRPEDMSNVNQIIDVIAKDGWVIAQEYLPEAAKGDTRLVLMNGLPLKVKGKYSAFQRIRCGGDLRSNLSAGGTLAKAHVTEAMLEVAEKCRPRLVGDGIFLAGLDLVGAKLMEINVFSPGGIGSAQRFEKVNFAMGIVEALEMKHRHANLYKKDLPNRLVAML